MAAQRGAAHCRDREEEAEHREPLTVRLGDTYSCQRKDGAYRDGEVVKIKMNKRAGREEYLIHYVGLARHQAEWVDKTRLFLFKPMKNGAEQKLFEDEMTTQEDEPEEDEPETKKMKVDTSGTVCEDEEHTCLLCSECCEFCDDPVVVECGHSFCHNCIDKAFENQDSFLCPDCEKVITKKKSATKLDLAAISKTADDASATLVQPLKKVKAQPSVLCPVHQAKMKLFCEDDGILGCFICRESLKHSGHKFLSVAEAMAVYRAELSPLVSPLQEALKEASKLSNQQSKRVEQLQNTITECRQHIMSEFGNLYNFLKERKEKLLEQLKEQSHNFLEEMKTNTAKMEANRPSLEETISVANQKVDETDIVSFLDGVKDVVTKCREQHEAVTPYINMMTEKQLCRATFKSPIQYFTWKQMESVISNGTEGGRMSRSRGGHKQIWMVGDVFLTAVYCQAKSGPLGVNLGFDKQTCILHWVHHSQKNYVLFQKLEMAKKDLLSPDIIFFHFSPTLECIELNFSYTFKRDLDKVAELLPNAELIVSALLPMPGHQMASLQLPRKKFNATLGAFVKKPHFHLFEHTQLEEKLTARFSNTEDELLREAEADLFITAVREVLQKAMCEDWKPVIEKCWTFCTADTGCEQIWIVGDGFMNLIKSHAEASPLGLNLGIPKDICDILWMESETWFDLFPKLETAAMSSGRPDVLLFHLGSKDLCTLELPTVISCAQDCFNEILRVFPSVKIILSTLLPKPESRESCVELRRNIFNHNLIAFAKQSPYYLFSHWKLQKKLTDRYDTGDLNPLTESEAKGFLQRIKNILQQTGLKDYKPRIKKCKLLPAGEVPSEEVQSEGIVKGPDHPSTSSEGDSAVTITGQDQQAIVRVEVPVPSAIPARPKEIWITGNSYIQIASLHAEKSKLGKNLGLDEQQWVVRWINTNWRNTLLPDMYQASRDLGMPSIVFLHVGSDDLPVVPWKALIEFFKYDISELAKRYPQTQFIFSKILPRSEWMVNRLEPIRKMVNKAICSFAEMLGFKTERFGKLERLLLFRIHKNQGFCSSFFTENEMLLSSIKRSIQEAILKSCEPRIAKCELLPAGEVQSEEVQSEGIVKGPDQPSTSIEGDSAVTRPKEIWIAGDSCIENAALHAEKSELGKNLGLDEQQWVVRWIKNNWRNTMLPDLCQASRDLGMPSIVFLHVGSNDLGVVVNWKMLMKSFKYDIRELAKRYPQTQFICSRILPRSEWMWNSLELIRRRFNKTLSSYAEMHGFISATFNRLEKIILNRLRKKQGSGSLSFPENEMFISSIKRSIQEAMMKDYRPRFEECELLPPGEVPSGEVQSGGIVKGPDQPSTSKEGDSVVTRPKEIWITGNAYIQIASLHAESSKFGKNLGLDEQQWVVRWMKTNWRYTLMNDLDEANRNLGMPSIVFLHVGSSDLGVVPCKILMNYFKYDISELTKLYPQTQFIFSAILPRSEWMMNALETNRRRFNAAICSYAKIHGFQLARTTKLEQTLLDRFHNNQGSDLLSIPENELLISTINLSIQEAIMKVSRRKNKWLQKGVRSTGDTLVVVPGSTEEPEQSSGTDLAACTEEDQDDVENTSDAYSSASTEEEEEEEEDETSDCLQPATEMETSEGSVAPLVDAPLPSDSESKQIWIVGNSYICRAAEQAGGGCYGFNLGFKPRNWTVHWMGRVAMCWEVLLSELNNARSTLGVPSIIFIHLGDNDVASVPYDTLKHTIEHDLNQIITQFPMTEFIFSTMLPKAEWLTNPLEQTRQDFNSALIRYAEEMAFHVVIYEDIEKSAIPRFNNGGSNVISDAEYDLFVKSIKDALEMIVLKLEKAHCF